MRLISTPLIAMALAATLLASCARRGDVSTTEPVADDDAICRANGVVAGSSAYTQCRKARDNQRGSAVNSADRAQRNLGEYMLNHPNTP
jgi:hypothetical protein